MLRIAPRAPLIWWAGIVFAFVVGMAVNNGYVTHTAINAEKGACHWTIGNELRKQQDRMQSQ